MTIPCSSMITAGRRPSAGLARYCSVSGVGHSKRLGYGPFGVLQHREGQRLFLDPGLGCVGGPVGHAENQDIPGLIV